MKSFLLTFVVAALGYFVDVYDLILFGVVRIESLRAIGISENQILDSGILLMNAQMAGMLFGGLFWGIAGDKKGRTWVMMASILIYSLANIGNAFVSTLNTYAILRFVAGFGLSGEVGAAVTLISETASANRRTLWTTLLTSFGLLGAVAASLVGDYFHWQLAYIVGGSMGLLLLLLRFNVLESKLFEASPAKDRGRVLLLLRSRQTFMRYLACILVGVPVWYCVGILMALAPELRQALGTNLGISAGKAIMYCYIGCAAGDMVSGSLSHITKSRRGIIGLFLIINAFLVTFYLNSHFLTAFEFYALCCAIGFFGAGYWSVYVTMVAENFGTNIRATAVITVTNFMRASVVLLTSGLQALHGSFFTLPQSALIIGTIVLVCSLFSLAYLADTFGKELDYSEL
ncbi:MAG: MFS transporter [Myxococcota bacterium]